MGEAGRAGGAAAALVEFMKGGGSHKEPQKERKGTGWPLKLCSKMQAANLTFKEPTFATVKTFYLF